MRNVSALMSMTCLAILPGCDDGPSVGAEELNQRLAQLEEKAKQNMVFIEGGTFTMGDFGAVGEDGVWRPFFPPTAERNKAHTVTLSSYSISNQKTTWEDFDTYLIANDGDVIERVFNEEWKREPFQNVGSSPFYLRNPAQVTWKEANDYCYWLGQRIQLPLALPTSAQWEFAARNRGSTEWIFSTHDGKPLHVHHDLYEQVGEGPEYVPVGSRLPPNPLGIYDMADNGKEWVSDWFSDTWYRDNPEITDPTGPADGTEKVVRNLDFSFSRIGMPESVPTIHSEDRFLVTQFTFRCALQSSTEGTQVE
ncbi:formylglycine-generating enzyme family protein [Halopseudomonas pertucinogena]|uniref:Sulfatase-modifying factor enzyme-like domain-containing protein n=1 Tax=Halopseudomonas pertucinogena TaxID=86175 RepID=A0ABQ2CM40_9GAMM|nr:formylglycine-generating enzyme family protein [Halopseudomonas pertucinogena]GGI90337.1 hypothetical protein GCM10009083_03370 [Halopseudomonas pertucinogena]